MNIIKKTFKQSALAVAFAAATLLGGEAALAAPLNLTTGDKITLGYGSIGGNGPGANGDQWGGGEFLVSGVAGQVANGPGVSFFTFCLEYSEHFSPGNQYFVNINTGTVNGGMSTAGTYAGDPSGGASFDPISKATAWLYTQFMTNATSLGYDMSGNNDQASAVNQARNDAFQLALWKLEGELGSIQSAYDGNAQAQAWVSQAIAGSSGWSDIGNVRVMNLYTGYSNGVFSGPSQDQLYMIPTTVSEPLSLALLGLGLLGFGFSTRRKQIAA